MRDDGLVQLPSNEYTLHWTSKTTKADVERWLEAVKPSHGGIGHAGWLWVRNDEQYDGNADVETMMKESQSIEAELTQRCQAIQDDPLIPVQGSNSKASHRRTVHSDIAEQFKALALRTGVTTGKWLLFVSEKNADEVWAKLVKAVTLGPARHAVITAKIASSDELRPTCLYVHNSWDRESVKAALVAIIRGSGILPIAYKPDVYTYAGIDSKHPSKMPASLYVPRVGGTGRPGFLTQEELDALKAEYEDVATDIKYGAGNRLGDGTEETPKKRKPEPEEESPRKKAEPEVDPVARRRAALDAAERRAKAAKAEEQ